MEVILFPIAMTHHTLLKFVIRLRKRIKIGQNSFIVSEIGLINDALAQKLRLI